MNRLTARFEGPAITMRPLESIAIALLAIAKVPSLAVLVLKMLSGTPVLE